MHIRKVAKSIGITTQELKKELQKVDFWVSADSSEIPDALISGIIRVLWPKFKDKKLRRLDRSWATKEQMNSVESEEFYQKSEVEILKETEWMWKVKSIREKIEEERKVEENKIKKDEEERVKWEQIRKIEREEREEREQKRKQERQNKFWNKTPNKTWEKPQEKTWERATNNTPEKKTYISIREKMRLEKEAEKKKVDLWKLSLPSEVWSWAISESYHKKKRRVPSRAWKWVWITHKIEIDSSKVKSRKPEKTQKRIRFKTLTQVEIDAMTEDERLQYFTELEEFKKSEDEAFKSRQKKRTKVVKNYDNQEQIKKKEWIVEIPEWITVKEFSEKVWIPVPKIIWALMKNWIMTTITQMIDFDTASLISMELDIQITREISSASAEELIEWDLTSLIQDDSENLIERAPVVVVMGHVDHWKTSILDFYRKANVVDKESWWITQHIWAYQVEKNKRKITFLDTPGHEAFTEMRARWAKVTDVAILVVAGDDWVKPQTREAYNHAVEAWVDIIIAINKMDKEWANIDKVKWELSEIWAVPEDWGWTIPCIPVSAKSWEWMEDLLERLLLTADMKELKANPNRKAVATIVESHLDKAMGPVATILINTWTLNVKDVFIAGHTMWRVKSMTDSNKKRHKKLEPSWVVQLAWFEEVPKVWDVLQVIDSEKEARAKVDQIKLIHENWLTRWIWMEEIQARIRSWRMNLLKVVLKADSQGSLEAIEQSLAKIKNKEVWVKIIHWWIWWVTESDVTMAAASWGIVLWFHVSVSPQTRNMGQKEWVDIKEYKIIYKLLDDIKWILTWMLSIEEIEKEVWTLVVKQIFYSKKKMMIIGWKVMNWVVQNEWKVKVFRKWEEIWEATISNLKLFKDDVSEVREWSECWLQLSPAIDVTEDDEIKVIIKEKITKTLE